MRKVVIILGCLLACLAVAAPARAAHRQSNQTKVDWAQHDTAVYVVSTLNLLRSDTGQSLPQLFKTQLHIKRYIVEADFSIPDLYFIDLVTADKTTVGVFAYKMGWQKPQAITDFPFIGIQHASPDIVAAYRANHRSKVATFKSTLPS